VSAISGMDDDSVIGGEKGCRQGRRLLRRTVRSEREGAHGDTLSIDTPSQGLAMAQGRISQDCSGLRPTGSTSAVRSWAAASAAKA
jgi:hypothetical protein